MGGIASWGRGHLAGGTEIPTGSHQLPRLLGYRDWGE